MKYAFIPALALILQGCNQGPYPTEQWLQGSWVPIEDGCESDVGIFFYDKGVVQTFDTDGIWNLNKDKLNITTTKVTNEDGTERNSNKQTVIELSDVSSHSFTGTYEDASVIRFKRCQTAEEMTKKNVVQKIIWEWSGGYTNSAFIQCEKITDNLKDYLNTGWKIVSTAPYERYVNGGTCQGRDIVLEREE